MIKNVRSNMKFDTLIAYIVSQGVEFRMWQEPNPHSQNKFDTMIVSIRLTGPHFSVQKSQTKGWWTEMLRDCIQEYNEIWNNPQKLKGA